MRYKPNGFDVEINVGTPAGQTVMQCPVHLIPRRSGDSGNPLGGVRSVILGKAKYLTQTDPKKDTKR